MLSTGSESEKAGFNSRGLLKHQRVGKNRIRNAFILRGFGQYVYPLYRGGELGHIGKIKRKVYRGLIFNIGCILRIFDIVYVFYNLLIGHEILRAVFKVGKGAFYIFGQVAGLHLVYGVHFRVYLERSVAEQKQAQCDKEYNGQNDGRQDQICFEAYFYFCFFSRHNPISFLLFQKFLRAVFKRRNAGLFLKHPAEI